MFAWHDMNETLPKRNLKKRGLTLAVSRAGVRSTEGTRKRSLWASA